jgi:hypothetical protein
MAELRRLAALPDDELGAVLRGIAPDLAAPPVPAPDADPARRARLRLEAEATASAGRRGILDRLGLRGPSARPVRRALVLAIVALVVLAAIAGAVGFGLPGIRIVFGPGPTPTASPGPAGSGSPVPPASPSASPSSSPGLPGATLNLGRPVSLEEARRTAPIPLSLPADGRFGPPDAVWIDDRGVVTIIWSPRPGVVSTYPDGLGLIVTELPGSVERAYFEKVLRPGTTIEPVRVRGTTGWWIAGSPHDFVYVDPSGEPVYDNNRITGDTLAWSDGTVTYRIETGLGRDEAIRIAGTLR